MPKSQYQYLYVFVILRVLCCCNVSQCLMRRNFIVVVVDLSRNRFSEVPADICNCGSVEQLNCYQNVIKSLPVAIVQLQNLVYLNLR